MSMKKIIYFSILFISVFIILMLLNIIFNRYDNVIKVDDYDDVLERIEKLKPLDSRINIILEDYDKYPYEVLNMLSRNIETLDFVLGYPENKGKLFGSSTIDVYEGNFPFLLQWDKRWGYASYGDSSIAVSGCAPTTLSMVIIGLTGDNTITPYVIAKYAEENGYYSKEGTSWSIMTEGVIDFGVQGMEIQLSKEVIFDYLNAGKPIICSMRPGDFTSIGHFIVLVGIEENKIILYDPNSISNSNILWSYDDISYQIKNLWVFDKN